MTFATIDPATGVQVFSRPPWDDTGWQAALAHSAAAQVAWAQQPVAARAAVLARLGACLLAQREPLAALMTLEMGKLTREALAEVDKCAAACAYYAERAPAVLQPQAVATEAAYSAVVPVPLGLVLGIMPWNYPLWQVVRCAVPILAGGNGFLLKHAPNVPQCAAALEQLLQTAGVPEGVFTTLWIDTDRVPEVLAHPAVAGVSLTGSERAGRAVAQAAAAVLKPSVLELGGSDPLLVLADADIDHAVAMAMASRCGNAGQACIAAKRLIVVPQVARAFVTRLCSALAALRMGHPSHPATTLAPLARADLRATLHAQVQASVAAGATLCLGGYVPEGPGWFYPATVLDYVPAASPAATEELFGPVACVLRARDEQDALRLAAATRYGLGASACSADVARTAALLRDFPAGAVFINSVVRSDPRLPFGGVKASGYGRELGEQALWTWMNQQTVWHNPLPPQ
jgi:acyl-CoA reductase-like NAD-dependent aldehyde dehydrogenase